MKKNKQIDCFDTYNRNTMKTENFRFFSISNYLSILGIYGHTFFIFLFLYIGVFFLVLFNVLSILIWCFVFFYNRRGNMVLTLILASIEIVFHAALTTMYLGWNSGFHIYILALIPYVFFAPSLKSFSKTLLSIIFCLIYLSMNIYSNYFSPLVSLNKATFHFSNYINIVGIFIIFSSFAYYYSKATNFSEQKLKEANRKLKSLSVTDYLTNLSNRRGMLESVDLEKSSSIIMCDIDDFKSFNDNYGHDCGDYVLVSSSAIIKSMLRTEDIVCRWGGEEFLLILPETDIHGAKLVAERIREKIENTEFRYNNQKLAITMTFGISLYHEEAEIACCINKADEALYQGKQKGKNCVSSLAN